MYSISDSSNEILPWHLSQWQHLQDRRKQECLPHALLFTGISGIGKHIFARQLAESLLCVKSLEDGQACGKCYACKWVAAGTHPDWCEVMPEEDKKPIKIDQIRSVVDFNYKTARFSRFKVIVIYQAHALNVNAANALLKTLEEPAQNTVIILVTEQLALLPATIRSRCQILNFSVPSSDVALSWLKAHYETEHDFEKILSLVRGAPLSAIDFLEKDEFSIRKTIFDQWMTFVRDQSELVPLGEKWGKGDVNRILDEWSGWVADMIRLSHCEDKKYIKNQDVINDLLEITLRVNGGKLYHFLDELNRSRAILRRSSGLNGQLLIEGLLIQWLEVYHAVS